MHDKDWGTVGILGCVFGFFGLEGMLFGLPFGLPLAIFGIILMLVTLFFYSPQ